MCGISDKNNKYNESHETDCDNECESQTGLKLDSHHFLMCLKCIIVTLYKLWCAFIINCRW